MNDEAHELLLIIENDGAMYEDMRHIRDLTRSYLEKGMPHFARIACTNATVTWVFAEHIFAYDHAWHTPSPEVLAEVAWELAARVYDACMDAYNLRQRGGVPV